MNELFRKDITIRIMSILLAVLFWLIVSDKFNPFTTRTFTNIPVKLENEQFLNENGYIIKNKYRTNIDVTIRGRQEAIDKVRTSDFEASLDFSQIKSVNDKSLKITGPFCSQKDVTIVSTNPPAIDVQLARNKNGIFSVELKSNITMKPGYVLLNTSISPDSFPIVVEESIIDSIGAVVADLDIKNLDRDTTKTVVCKVFNKDGSDISNLFTDLKVNVKLEVAKEVPVSLVTRGRLPVDYIETLRVIDPVKVMVSGPADTLAALTEIKTAQVDIDSLNGNYSSQVPIMLPNGLRLVNSPDRIAVSISVEKLAVRDIELGKNDISILNGINDGSLTYEIKTEKLVIQIKGRKPEVDAVSIESLRPGVDVSGLDEGTHRLPLNMTMPSEVKLISQDNVEVKITKTPVVPAAQIE